MDKKRVKSCGILLYRYHEDKLQVFIAKFGGKSWENRFLNAWTFPKGEMSNKDSLDLDCAFREFKEETSLNIDFDISKLIDLGEFEFEFASKGIKTEKTNHIFAYEYDLNPSGHDVNIIANLFFDENNDNLPTPELQEKAYYFDINKAYRMLVKSQTIFLDRLKIKLDYE